MTVVDRRAQAEFDAVPVSNGQPAARLGTSLRSRSAEATCEVAQRLLPALGVSEVLDVTRLDHLGLPVFMSVRPRGSAARLHSGKGMTPADARAGALMEAVEYAASESASAAGADRHLPWSGLVAGWPDGLDVVDFAPRLGARVRWRAQVAAVECERLQSRQRVGLPAELVLLPMPPRSGPAVFGSSSNGLASGNTLEEATLHALLEVLERDTVALHLARDASHRLASGSLPQPFLDLSRAWRRRGVALLVRQLPNALGLPCFEAGLHDATAGLASLVLSRGWGLHFDRRVALSRAICEAAQSRLAVILAHRPDVPGGAEAAMRLGPAPAPQTTARLLANLAVRGRRVHFDAVPYEVTPSVREALQSLLRRLPAAGLGPVFRRRLYLGGSPAALRGLQVVKVVVAHSETPVGEHPRMGPRLLARLRTA